ncbi:MAG: polysulfide reductase NrfD [Candidatus Marinimicrobia bacterium]|nr:polysulfide reductase NrfD [Candidatus Neomarinimicrobiota bacterium]
MAEILSQQEMPLVGGHKSIADVSDDVVGILDRQPTWLWWLGITLSSSALLLGIVSVTYQIRTGIGTWGLNRTVGWAFDITNFVFWVGIGHAGTLISAILFLFRQKWRTAINRSAETMTLIAVMCAGIFPIIHMGRPWLFMWMFPYPNARGSLWINFRSPLAWDVFAILTYLIISAMFWYIGLMPDLATVRDRAKSKIKRAIFGVLSFGWNGSFRTWHRYETVYLLLAAVAAPLVVSVHTVVSFDFATSAIPGWHSTIFPPYFVSGAIFSGFAMVLTLMLIARKTMRLEDYITVAHVEKMTKIIILTGGIVAISYVTEFFIAWYSQNGYEQFVYLNRAFGPYRWAFFIMFFANLLTPQFFWFKRIRTNMLAVFILSLLINVGMWFERFVIIVTSLHRDFLPSSWAIYVPTLVEIGTLVGSFGLFFTLFLLFIRFLPMISIGEIKAVVDATSSDGAHHE